MSDVVDINVLGIPVPQGSLRPLISKGSGKAVVPQDDQRLLRYRADIRTEGQKAMRSRKLTLMAWAVNAQITFVLPRPKDHFLPANSRREVPELHPHAPVFPMGPPDLDKLVRAVLDALTGIVYADDAQVVGIAAHKLFADEPVFGGLTRIRMTGGNGR